MIVIAKQEGTTVYAYNENGSIAVSHGGELVGFTEKTVSIKEGSTVYVYDESGRIVDSF